ncbi:choice-of-anchor J domain-containing protein [Actinocrispum wychmicini]|uniref:Immune inhibitor A peptidase M6 n=1 Tax=Actinocrispum wychmicini TaxID=1213861 RepID=A0A4R2JS06_9PSEU|nr:choice-of-anchor J domain-containing protein [Actinocrispum wychmicini]TCO62354.1 immune inhibitor A peptidase M6 [Actinocrispum wychmicini]
MARSRRAAAAAILVLPLVVALPATHAAAAPDRPVTSDTREMVRKNFTLEGKPVEGQYRYQPNSPKAKTALAPSATPPVGTVRQWLGSDDVQQKDYRKDYTLRGVGKKIEVWVANDRAFPAGDCRAQIPGTTDVTDAQVNELISEFDNNIYPKETAAFSTPPGRDGTHAILKPDANGNGGVYTGDGDKTVTLVDNIRDDNYYNFPARPTYTAGFFSQGYDELFDRNVMNIDVFDWAHRTTATPPNQPTSDLCTSRPAKPWSYEGTFAHEWQHLLHSYTDPFEGLWMNEGLSDFAMNMVGYSNGLNTINDPGSDGHLMCFQGWTTVQTPNNPNPRDCGGAENSLNLWGESSNPNAVLADYGNAYQFMLYLHDRFGDDIMSRLHRDGKLQGLASLQAQLAAEGENDMYKVIHDYQSSVLLDKIVGERGGIMLGVPKSRVTSKSVRSTVNLANPTSYATPGAGPNGADFVQLRGPNGTVLRGCDLRSITFEGVRTLPPLPLTWSLVTNDPDRPGNSVLWSGNSSNLNATAVTSVAVPTTDPTLRFQAKYGAEFGFDYAYVVVSTDGGATYTAVKGDKTGDAPLGPGLNGTTNGFEPHTFDLSAYAGKTVLLGFKYVSDAGTNEGGFKVDDVTIGGTQVSDGTSLASFKSPTQIKPADVHNWNVRLIGIDENHSVALQLDFNGKPSLKLNPLQVALLSVFPKVVAVVAYDEPTETINQYASYTLKVNGVTQPGGA